MSEHRTVQSARTIDAADFEARCLSLIEEVAESREPITITKEGRPISRLVPCTEEEPRRNGPPFPDPWGADRDIILWYDDLDEPVDPDWEEKWDRKWDERLK